MARNADETRFSQQRDRVLKAAAHCFNRKGYSGTSLKDVANMLGLTDPALYYYVRNKEELVYLCYVRAADVGRLPMFRFRDVSKRLIETNSRRYEPAPPSAAGFVIFGAAGTAPGYEAGNPADAEPVGMSETKPAGYASIPCS